MNLNTRNAIEHDDLVNLAKTMADQALWIFDSDIQQNEYTRRHLKTALNHYTTWTKNESVIKRLKLAVTCLAFAIHNVLDSRPEQLTEEQAALLKGALDSYAEARNEAGYFLLHPEKGCVRLIEVNGKLRYQQPGGTASHEDLDALIDPPFAMWVFMHQDQMIFEPSGPMCPSFSAFMEAVMLDGDKSSKAYGAKEKAGVNVIDPAKYGYTSLVFPKPEEMYDFVMFLEEYFQQWMTEAQNSGSLTKLLQDHQQREQMHTEHKNVPQPDARLTKIKPKEVTKVCAIHDGNGKLVMGIKPQFLLKDLDAAAAEWACGQFIPTVLAQQAVMATLIGQGYSVVWYEMSPIAQRNA